MCSTCTPPYGTVHGIPPVRILEILQRVNTGVCMQAPLCSLPPVGFLLFLRPLREVPLLPSSPCNTTNASCSLPVVANLFYVRCSSRFLFLRVALAAITRKGKHDADLSTGLSGDVRNLLRLNCI